MSDLCPDCGLPNPDTNPYCFCKPMRLNRGGENGSQDQGAHGHTSWILLGFAGERRRVPSGRRQRCNAPGKVAILQGRGFESRPVALPSPHP